MSAWDSCSDAELTAAIAEAVLGIVMIGFKEADATRGVDEHGNVLVSSETVERMKSWLLDQGIEIEREAQFIPMVDVRMPAVVDLVSTVRNHPNVDYVEPNTAGEYLGGAGGRRIFDLVLAVSISIGEENGVPVYPGESLTATYQQPDGSVLTARVSVNE